jgi:phosphate transport system protein
MVHQTSDSNVEGKPMTRHIDQEYDQIRHLLLKMGGMVEENLVNAIKSLQERDPQLAHDVIRGDRAVDAIEKRIDEEVMTVLARQQPTAIDLRFLVAVLKITTDLERIGDLTANISRSARRLSNEPPLEVPVDLPRLAREVRLMVDESLGALVHKSAEQAMAVWKKDDDVDALHREIDDHLVDFMAAEPTSARRALQLLHIARNLERIADHATNIAEYVIYYVQGRDIRHSATDYDGEDTQGPKEES